VVSKLSPACKIIRRAKKQTWSNKYSLPQILWQMGGTYNSTMGVQQDEPQSTIGPCLGPSPFQTYRSSLVETHNKSRASFCLVSTRIGDGYRNQFLMGFCMHSTVFKGLSAQLSLSTVSTGLNEVVSPYSNPFSPVFFKTAIHQPIFDPEYEGNRYLWNICNIVQNHTV
jgi:hypothetical protein